MRGAADRLPAFRGQTSAGTCHQLPRVGLAGLQDLGDAAVRIVEGLPQHVGGALHGIQLLQEEQDRQVECLGPLRAQVRIRRRVNGLGKPGARIRLAPYPGGLGHVDRQPDGDRREKGGRFVDPGAIGALPAQPRLLDDILGLHRTAEYAVGDAEEPGPRRDEVPRGLVEGPRVVASAHACPPLQGHILQAGPAAPPARGRESDRHHGGVGAIGRRGEPGPGPFRDHRRTTRVDRAHHAPPGTSRAPAPGVPGARRPDALRVRRLPVPLDPPAAADRQRVVAVSQPLGEGGVPQTGVRHGEQRPLAGHSAEEGCLGVDDHLAHVPPRGQHFPDEVVQAVLLRSGDLHRAEHRHADGAPGDGSGDVVRRHRTHPHGCDMYTVRVGHRTRHRLDRLEERCGTHDGVGDRRPAHLLLLQQFRPEVPCGQTLGPHDGQHHVVLDPCRVSGVEQVARRGAEERPARASPTGRRVGDVHHQLGTPQRLGEALSRGDVDALGARHGHDLQTVVPKPDDRPGTDSAGGSRDNDSHVGLFSSRADEPAEFFVHVPATPVARHIYDRMRAHVVTLRTDARRRNSCAWEELALPLSQIHRQPGQP
ncbi:hypothetical protein SCOCK_150016 [Actinacidiphila cocklensis]|uniref:Uncharacterized protein n=1 Tax=Actinacidiphila cocklensis TaxID=887465 RepID=A0A9W4DL58_9ACTN|nr:hypothetical protein SCOCK_150016 [Actinacidiphila cocklensis]